MAEAGAKVLNAQAVEFAKERGIAIYARATQGPLPGTDPSLDGTVVRRHSPRMPGTVVGVASERDIILLEGDALSDRLLALLDERGVAGKQLHIFGDRDDGRRLAREPPRRSEAARGAADATRVAGLVSSTGWRPSASLAPESTAAMPTFARDPTRSRPRVSVPAGIATSSFRITWLVPRDRTDRRRSRAASSVHRVARVHRCRWKNRTRVTDGRLCT